MRPLENLRFRKATLYLKKFYLRGWRLETFSGQAGLALKKKEDGAKNVPLLF